MKNSLFSNISYKRSINHPLSAKLTQWFVMYLPLFVTDLLLSFLRITITNSNFVVCLYLFVCLPSAISQVFSGAQPLGGYGGGMTSPTSISEPNKVQKCQFQTSGMLLFTDVQKVYGPEILQFLPRMLEFLDNLWRVFTFSNYIEEIDHFTLDLLKRSDT